MVLPTEPANVAFLAAAALHLGFQLVVTVLVYPALARVPAVQFAPAHLAHTRGITPVVVPVYGLLLLTGGWAVLSGPGVITLSAVAAGGAALLVTAVSAGPTHGRLGAGHSPVLVRRLLRADRLRLAAAVACAAAAALA